MFEREVKLPWAAEPGVGRSADDEGRPARARRRPQRPGPERGGLEARLFLASEEVVLADAYAEDEGDEADEDVDADWGWGWDWDWGEFGEVEELEGQ